MSCKHENADHLMPGDVFYPAYGSLGEFAVTVEQFRCLDCGEWLPLGPSNDEPAAVQVEIRAAELAQMHRVSVEQWPHGMDGQEPHGWLGRKCDDDPIEPKLSYWAGWLARHIVEHDEKEQR